jgi:hypothetical protein
VLGLGLLITPVAVAIAAELAPRLQLPETAANASAFAGATLFPILGLSLAALVEVPLAVALSVAAIAAASLITSAVWQPTPLVTVLLVDSALVGLSWALGCTLGRRVQHASHLLPACVVAASADIVSLLSPEGPSHAIAESERALSVLAVWFPVPGGPALAPALGVGDLLFMALALGVARTHALPYARCVAACAAGTALSGVAAAYFGRAIPALVSIAAMLVLALPPIRRLRRSDRTVAVGSMLIAGTLALATLARTWLNAR